MLADLAPRFLYAGALAPAPTAPSPAAPAPAPRFTAASPAERSSSSSLAFPLAAAAAMTAAAPAEKKVELYSPEFYKICAMGGALCCGATHTAVTPLDVVKCNMQTNPAKFPSIGAGFGVTAREGGLRGLVRGWVPTLFGYSIQGAAKFGLYGGF
jgi:solute carrier family 25 (mitochondrial phosphate transporter), member 3